MFTVYFPELHQTAEKVLQMNRDYFSGKWSDEQLKSYQTNELKKTIHFVKEHSDFYKEHLSDISDEFIQNFTLNDLNKLPFTDKMDLRREMFSMLSKPLNECCFYYETTGTTGIATPCPRDYVDTIYNNMAVTSCLSTILKSGTTKHFVGVCGPTEVHSFGDTLGDVCKNMGLAIAKFWAYSPVIGIKKAVELLQELKITALMCTPGMALTLAKSAKILGYDPRKDFSLEIIMLTGELGSEAMMENIGNLWNAKTYNFLYGSQEALVLSTAVENKKMHTFPINYHYEVINPETLEQVDYVNGVKEGELVVSMLFQGSKPLVRYRTGDVVRLYEPNVASELLPSPAIEILGRTRDGLKLNALFVQAYDLEQRLMEQLTNSLGYQIIIYNQHGQDKLDIKIEMLNKEDEVESNIENIKSVFKKHFEIDANIEYTQLGAITTTGSMVSWKAARIIDKREEKARENIEAEAIAQKRELLLSSLKN